MKKVYFIFFVLILLLTGCWANGRDPSNPIHVRVETYGNTEECRNAILWAVVTEMQNGWYFTFEPDPRGNGLIWHCTMPIIRGIEDPIGTAFVDHPDVDPVVKAYLYVRAGQPQSSYNWALHTALSY